MTPLEKKHKGLEAIKLGMKAQDSSDPQNIVNDELERAKVLAENILRFGPIPQKLKNTTTAISLILDAVKGIETNLEDARQVLQKRIQEIMGKEAVFVTIDDRFGQIYHRLATKVDL